MACTIMYITETEMARRPERDWALPGFWIVNPGNRLFDGPFETVELVLKRYQCLPGRLRSLDPFGKSQGRTFIGLQPL